MPLSVSQEYHPVKGSKDSVESVQEAVENCIKQSAGTLRVFPEVTVNGKDLREMMTAKDATLQLMDMVMMSFDLVLDFEEKKPLSTSKATPAIIGSTPMRIMTSIQPQLNLCWVSTLPFSKLDQ